MAASASLMSLSAYSEGNGDDEGGDLGPDGVRSRSVDFREDGGEVVGGVVEGEKFVGEGEGRGDRIDREGGEVMDLYENGLCGGEFV